MNESAKELYPDFYGAWDYQPIIDSFGKVIIQVDDGEWQGDSRILYQDGCRYGWLQFGWGSCSGCDALKACDTIEEIQELIDELREKIMWFENADEAINFFNTHDWDADYSRCEAQYEFIRKCLEHLGGL